VVDLELGELREISLRREDVERLNDVLAITHQVEQLSVVISITLPKHVGRHLIQSLKPSLNSNSMML
jgi:hypothetical protein